MKIHIKNGRIIKAKGGAYLNKGRFGSVGLSYGDFFCKVCSTPNKSTFKSLPPLITAATPTEIINIAINIPKIKLELITKSFDWSKFTKKLNNIIDKKFGIDEDESLKTEYELLKEKINNIKSKYKPKNKLEYKEYAKKNKLEVNPEQKFINHGWKNYYDFLGLDISKYPDTLDELKKICKNHCLDNEDVYMAKCERFKIPEMPEEISKYGLSNILCLFEKKIKLIR